MDKLEITFHVSIMAVVVGVISALAVNILDASETFLEILAK